MKNLVYKNRQRKISVKLLLDKENQDPHDFSIYPGKTDKEKYIEVQENVYLHITDIGTGTPIVFIHGWPFSNEIYKYQNQALVEKGFRCIAITLRGFGKSDKPFGKHNYDIYARDIKVVLDTLDLKDVLLAGHSMGGAVAIRYMALFNQARVAKLALISAAAPVWTQRYDFPFSIPVMDVNKLIALCNLDRAELIRKTGNYFFISKQAMSPLIGHWFKKIALQASHYATVQALIALRDTDLRPDLAAITVPTGIFHGVHDKICSFLLTEQLKAGIKNAFIVPFHNSGHAIFIEEKDELNKELEAFARN